MKTVQLWDHIHHDGHDWQIIAIADHQAVLRCLDGPGVQILPLTNLINHASAPAQPPTPIPVDLDVLSLLPDAECQRVEVLDHHLHELWHGTPPRSPAGIRPRPEYDPDQHSLSERLQAKSKELTATGTPLGKRQLQRYLTRWRQHGKAGLVDPRRLSASQDRCSPDLVALIEEYLSAQTARSTGSATRAIALVSVQAREMDVLVPSRATMYRLMARLDRGRRTFGNATTRRTRANSPQRAFGHQSPTRPGELTEIDSTPLDLLVLYPDGSTGRVDLTALVDIATRTVCGAILTPIATKAVDAAVLLARSLTPPTVQPGWTDALELARALAPSGAIAPTSIVQADLATRPVIMVETVTVDRGKVFLSETFLAACERLEIGVTVAAPRTPTDKPHIERIFGSINAHFTQHLAGYTGANVVRRGRDVAAEAVWPLAVLQSVLDVWLTQVWQNLPQDGLRHPAIPQRKLSPNEMYEILSIAAPTAPTVLERDDYIALLPRQWRAVQRYGVNFHGLVYDSPGLDPLRSRPSGLRHPGLNGRWEVRYDPYRMNTIWIRDHHHNTWIEAPWRLAHLSAGPFSLEILEAAKKVMQQPATHAEPTTVLAEILRIQTGLQTAAADRDATNRLRQRSTATPIIPATDPTNTVPSDEDERTEPPAEADGGDDTSPELTLLPGRRYRPVRRILYGPPTQPPLGT